MNDLFSNYQDKVVLVTGHTGFKGSWLSIWLNELGAKVVGVSLDPKDSRDNFLVSNVNKYITDIRGDIRDVRMLNNIFEQYKPEYVFHLAAQPLVKYSYEHPIETYETNIMGTVNVLECIRKTKETKYGIMITTDKCYRNYEQIWPYREDDPMGGYDPYSASKGCCELVIDSYRNAFFSKIKNKNIASARAGNVIGGGDWSKDRLFVDCIKNIENNTPIKIRNPKAVRPWQHVLEALYGYLLLGQRMSESNNYCQGFNFGPENEAIINVWKVASMLIKFYGKGELIDNSMVQHQHEAQLLSLDITKAKTVLGWKPMLSIEEAIKLSVDWYKNYTNKDCYTMCINQINYYTKLISERI